MTKQSIKRSIERRGFTYVDIDTPEGTVRITAHVPTVPVGDGGDGHRVTIVTAMRDGDELVRRKKTSRAAGVSAFMELVDRYRS